jgi:protein-arginine kinase activator protein McsA
MALIECPECGGEYISEIVDACPICGHSFKDEKKNYHFSCSDCNSFEPHYEVKNIFNDCI